MRHHGKNQLIVVDLFRPAHEFDASLFFVCELNVVFIHITDSEIENFFRLHIHAKGMDADNDEFEKRVPTSNIKSGVALSEAQLLCQFQRLCIIHSLVEDFGKDKIRRPIKNTFHANQQIIIVVFLQITNHGNAAASRSIVKERRVVLALECNHLVNVARQHFFITAHHRQLCLKCALHDSVSSLGIVDEFHDKIHTRVGENVVGLVGKFQFGCFGLMLRHIAHTHLHDVYIFRFNFLEHIVETFAHGAKAKQAYIDSF